MRLESLREGPLVQRSIADIHEANALLDLALGVFRSGANDEPVQTVDVSALLQSMVDEPHRARTDRWRSPAVPAFSRRYRGLALRRVLDNLLNNAIHYQDHAPRTFWSRNRATNASACRCDDAGPGIDPALLESVFQPFFRIESSRNRSTGGSGLGLYSRP